jgi:hypothetical protein
MSVSRSLLVDSPANTVKVLIEEALRVLEEGAPCAERTATGRALIDALDFADTWCYRESLRVVSE